jgi:hypothetical protein
VTTTYLATAGQIVGTANSYETVYHTDGIQHPTRVAAWVHGCRTYGSDDFRIATLTDGCLTAIGWGAGGEAKDFDPIDEDLGGLARQLGLKLDKSWKRPTRRGRPRIIPARVVELVDRHISSSIGDEELSVCCYLCDPIEGKPIARFSGTVILADIIEAGIKHLTAAHAETVNHR